MNEDTHLCWASSALLMGKLNQPAAQADLRPRTACPLSADSS